VPALKGPRRPTVGEVASAAGVSPTTVSRVLNGSARVSPEAREAVQETIVALGYVPNRAARSLVRGRTNTVALVISEPEERVFGDPFFSAMVRGISAAVTRAELQLVLLLSQSAPERVTVERYVTQGHVDGVILMSLHDGDRLPDLLADAHIPTVLSGRPMGTRRLMNYVDADNRGGGQLAADHLLSIGRRRIATVTGPMEMPAAVDRFEGYCDALRAAGTRLSRSLVEPGDFTDRSGSRAMTALLARNPDLDAVFVASDPMAIGALQALERAGRRVPDDVAVVGFDDVPMAEYTSPPLTTIRQPLEQMSVAMADLLLPQIREQAVYDGLEHAIFPTTLVRRSSA
jgi:DNA-binding LacI/PurR family transcriptional regulator